MKINLLVWLPLKPELVYISRESRAPILRTGLWESVGNSWIFLKLESGFLEEPLEMTRVSHEWAAVRIAKSLCKYCSEFLPRYQMRPFEPSKAQIIIIVKHIGFELPVVTKRLGAFHFIDEQKPETLFPHATGCQPCVGQTRKKIIARDHARNMFIPALIAWVIANYLRKYEQIPRLLCRWKRAVALNGETLVYVKKHRNARWLNLPSSLNFFLRKCHIFCIKWRPIIAQFTIQLLLWIMRHIIQILIRKSQELLQNRVILIIMCNLRARSVLLHLKVNWIK